MHIVVEKYEQVPKKEKAVEKTRAVTPELSPGRPVLFGQNGPN
jgi:hypothetical protein